MELPHKEKILILVKTYPTKSKKYVETVCTAGIREDGSWIRIFPITFRRLEDYLKYKKYQWIECNLYKTENDNRPESYHIDDINSITLGDIIESSDNWMTRRRIILDKVKIFTKISDLLKFSNENIGSLATFKPTDVTFSYEKAKDDEEDDENIEKSQLAQWDLFEDNDWRINFKGVEKIPYNFYYEITDDDGVKFKHKIIDWEINALFYKQRNRYGEEKALHDVIKQYGELFLNKDKIDLYLYLGTMKEFHQRNFPDPWIIIGVAPFKKLNQNNESTLNHKDTI